MRSWKQAIALLIVFCVTTVNAFAQCAMCRGTVESTMSNGRNHVGVGLNTGIVYLFVTPYLLVAVIAYLWYQNSRKEHGKRLEITDRVRRALS